MAKLKRFYRPDEVAEIFGISQTELANKLNITSSTISDYEGGRRKSPGIGVISRLVASLLELDRKRGGKIKKQLEDDPDNEELLISLFSFAQLSS